ncbi:MBL fold metallo-hydrolase [Pacificispira spongiicola]|nr:MBL fold metallo-hydrolase [Pacificispira spongiicola]
MRCSLLVTTDQGQILIDTAPDMREQLLAAEVRALDSVFYTHLHADQAHGIDDLRALALINRHRIPVYAEPDILDQLTTRFDYCFQQIKDYPPILDANALMGPIDRAGVTITPIRVQHGVIDATGYRIGNAAYFPDVSEIPEERFADLDGLELLIVDALRYKPHPSHAHLDRALTWIERIKPGRAVLTNLHMDLDYGTLCRTLPDGVVPAFDGMEIDLSD